MKIEQQVRATGLIKTADGQELTVDFPVQEILKAEATVGPLLDLSDWFRVPSDKLYLLLHAGLKTHHPAVTAERARVICDSLDLETFQELKMHLCRLAFPRRMAELEKKYATAPSPNGQSGDGH